MYNQTTTLAHETITVSDKTSQSIIATIWNRIPKTVAVLLFLEVITIYGLLFFVSPIGSTQDIKTLEPTALTANTLIANTNTIRHDYNLATLKVNPELTKAAQHKAQYILDTDYFNHNRTTGETFSSWIRETDYTYRHVGENLAIHFESPNDVITAWMQSELHKKNILNPLYQDIGIAVLSGDYQGKQTTVIVQLFGTPLTE